jgi:hypothetical protein
VIWDLWDSNCIYNVNLDALLKCLLVISYEKIWKNLGIACALKIAKMFMFTTRSTEVRSKTYVLGSQQECESIQQKMAIQDFLVFLMEKEIFVFSYPSTVVNAIVPKKFVGKKLCARSHVINLVFFFFFFFIFWFVIF